MARTKKDKYTVIAPFKDAKEYGENSYNIGDDVSSFDADRLKDLISRKLVETSEKETEE